MVGVSGIGSAANTLARGGELGEALLLANRAGKGVDVTGLSRDLAQLAQRDPKGAADAIESARKGLTPVERGEFDRALPQSIAEAQRAGATAPKELGGVQKELALDLTQMGLDVAGLFDPTPVSDGANGVISLLRGDFLGAGISAVSMIPYIGDAAKLGKLGTWGKTVAHAVEIAKTDSAFAKAAKPALDVIASAIGAAPKKVIDALPKSARDTLATMKREIDGLGGAAARKADDVAALGSASAKAGKNEVKWTLDAKGRPTTATATLSELQPKGAARGSAETSAQDAVRARGKADDDAGHIIGHRFLSDQGTRNMFPQNFNFNRSAYKTMENEWASWIEAGGTVKVNVALKGGDGARPDKVAVVYEVFNDAGKSVYKKVTSFNNTSGQTFNRVPAADIRAKLGQ